MTSDAKELLQTKNGGRFGKALRKEFLFEEGFRNLNHGSFGTYPRAIRDVFRSFQDAHEAQPDDFIRYQYPKHNDKARQALSKYLNVPTSELVFVQNATTGVNTVLRSLIFAPNEYILYSASIYGACEKAVAYITETTPAKAAKIEYTFPVEDDWLVSAFAAKIDEIEKKGGKVKVAVFDTVVSMPGVRLPFERITQVCREKGVLSLIDGAHGIGHVELDLKALDADFFVSNCHKWLHVPRGCAIFHVPLRNQSIIRSTLPTSHGFIPSPSAQFSASKNPLPPSNAPKSDFELNFEFIGTIDASSYLCVPAALKWRESIGGEDTIIRYNQTLAKHGAKRMAEILGTNVLDNETQTLTKCCMANVALPLDAKKMYEIGARAGLEEGEIGIAIRDWMSRAWIDDYKTFMQSMFYAGRWWIRMSGQVYLEMEDFEWAAGVVKEVCARAEKGEWAVKGKARL
ncbi:PLP-dependent transferase [Paraphaeosphaeria sporulosa]|uniref:PLP-dependent transferase n=1 Tax=Paraphaeosphaeria sporulosa TaxID=1460663 RepID=A0A177CGI3_9PLEO|nr:PLP-dependent transferase [Paraphaeosphaeria sporulosa]OAG06052.1 PLP-dependent transferase [Paraphaeosphaeria sporulosa]